MMPEVYIHAPKMSQFGKHSTTVLELSLNTAKKSLSEFQNHKIEFLIFTSFCPENYTGEYHIPNRIAEGLGLTEIFCLRSETASSSGASAFHLACNLIESGRFESGMVVATEIMSKLDREANNLLLGKVLSPKQISLGMSMAQGGALVANRYMHEFGYTKKDLFALSKKLHDNGCHNPNAQIQKNISWENYSKSPMIASPLCLYDISPLSDGSVSLIVSKNKSKVKVRGLGYGTAAVDSSIINNSFPASNLAFDKAYKDAKLNPKDIRVAELHDAFTIFEIIGMEDSGMFEKGKGLKSVVNGETHPDNRLPINPSGGLKSRGHPVGASGLAQIAEIIRFWNKRPELNIGLTHSIGGLATNNFVTILEHLS
ncbi:thiolase family protein [Leptospira sp. GIMC2001]|uniref:thiolase family protein n=1 Tax=Leptospira sp. GIMC2001 TaxID=1513297 RepID=UPI00234BE878|nr:thiolase family protein [Leptospira sp. GIMC2001]WCL51349.1 thiolase family protein [Leptospira sp. GIMC2001]